MESLKTPLVSRAQRHAVNAKEYESKFLLEKAAKSHMAAYKLFGEAIDELKSSSVGKNSFTELGISDAYSFVTEDALEALHMLQHYHKIKAKELRKAFQEEQRHRTRRNSLLESRSHSQKNQNTKLNTLSTKKVVESCRKVAQITEDIKPPKLTSYDDFFIVTPESDQPQTDSDLLKENKELKQKIREYETLIAKYTAEGDALRDALTEFKLAWNEDRALTDSSSDSKSAIT